ncbi:ABC transporter ATP-binding protein [Ferviditalea candida]|uniref:ATP-binding cassette domain-containing protein n=1 Tax=Ferviditalea candida TaxID=3108399 RepID=A0ABU5ZGA0_9BACL|nr:ATP-binding cassette domain-containing protein [Paenibacillaceae bacterium T2]
MQHHSVETACVPPVLELLSVEKTFARKRMFGKSVGKQVLRGVSFSVHKGETLALVGGSGSGKSTTARLILGLDRISGGEIRYKGHDIQKLSNKERRRLCKELQVVFQDPTGSVNPRMNVLRIVSEPLLANGYRKEDAVGRVEEVLEMVGLNASDMYKYPHQFSGGQLQRIGIARAIALNPELIILDEPTSALDVSVQARILKLLKHLQADLGLTYLFITHDLNVVQSFADRVLIMSQGEIVESGTVSHIFDHSQHPYTKLLLDSNLFEKISL